MNSIPQLLDARGQPIVVAPASVTRRDVARQLDVLPMTGTGKVDQMADGTQWGWAYDESQGRFDMAAILDTIPSTLPDSSTYLDAISEYSSTISDHASEIELCWKLYQFEPVCRTATDALLAFAVTPIRIDRCRDDELNTLLRAWISRVNRLVVPKGGVPPIAGLDHVIRQILLHREVSGDAVTWEVWDSGVALSELPGKKYTLPVNIRVLDILNLEISKAFKGLGQEQIFYRIDKLDGDITAAVKNPGRSEYYRALNEAVPLAIRRAIQRGEDRVALDPKLTKHFQRKQAVDSAYGVSYLRPAFTAVSDKRRLQYLDATIMMGLITRLTIVMVGHKDPDSPYHTVMPARANLLKSLLTQRNAQNLLVWAGSDLDILDITPPAEILNFQNKFKAADDAVSAALGVPRLLIDGLGAGTNARDWGAFKSTIARLREPREEIISFINEMARQIAEVNGFDEVPVLGLAPMDLYDDRLIRNTALSAYRDGVLSHNTTQTMIGVDAEVETQKQIDEGEEDLYSKIPMPPVAFTARQPGRPTDVVKVGPERAQEEPEYDLWLEQMQAGYDNMVRVAQIRAEEEDAERAVVAAIVGGFMLLESLTNGMLRALYSLQLGREVTFADEDVIRLHTWNMGRLLRFRENVQRAVLATMRDREMPPGALPEAVAGAFASQRYRLGLYVNEGTRKVDHTVRVDEAKRGGMVGAYWICAFRNSCEVCEGHHGHFYSMDEIWELYPVHPNCQDDFEFLDEFPEEREMRDVTLSTPERPNTRL